MTSDKTKKQKGLRYTGKKFVLGIPARNLSEDEVKRIGRERIMRTGLYEEYEEVVIDKPKRTRHDKGDESENLEVDYGRTEKAT